MTTVALECVWYKNDSKCAPKTLFKFKYRLHCYRETLTMESLPMKYLTLYKIMCSTG